MDISTATLCDFAQVRERLLFVSSAGITRLYRPEMPTVLGSMFAVILDVPVAEASSSHELDVLLVGPGEAELMRVQGNVTLGEVKADPAEVIAVPMAFDFRATALQAFGPHEVQIRLDGELRRTSTFQVIEAPAA